MKQASSFDYRSVIDFGEMDIKLEDFFSKCFLNIRTIDQINVHKLMDRITEIAYSSVIKQFDKLKDQASYKYKQLQRDYEKIVRKLEEKTTELNESRKEVLRMKAAFRELEESRKPRLREADDRVQESIMKQARENKPTKRPAPGYEIWQETEIAEVENDRVYRQEREQMKDLISRMSQTNENLEKEVEEGRMQLNRVDRPRSRSQRETGNFGQRNSDIYKSVEKLTEGNGLPKKVMVEVSFVRDQTANQYPQESRKANGGQMKPVRVKEEWPSVMERNLWPLNLAPIPKPYKRKQ